MPLEYAIDLWNKAYLKVKKKFLNKEVCIREREVHLKHYPHGFWII